MIAVTGTSGFIGRRLIQRLVEKYNRNEIVAIGSSPVSQCKYLPHHDFQFEDDYFRKSGFGAIDTIIHAGAFIPKAGSESNDWKRSLTNITSTSALLKSNLPMLKRFIFISSIDVYGTDKIITEQSPIDPGSLYGSSKLFCERLIFAWAQATGKIHQVLRVGHVYGPGEEAYKKVIPETLRRLAAGEVVQQWGNGEEIRSFIYVDDVVEAIINSLSLEQSLGPVNIVGTQSTSIGDLIRKMIVISGGTVEIEQVPSASSPRSLIFDASKMRDFLLKKETDLTKGLTNEWIYTKALFV